jgi:hypothetical protein
MNNYPTKSILVSTVLLLTFLFCSFSSSGQKNTSYFDGPYIFHQKDSLHIQWIERGMGYDTLIAKKDAGIFKRDSLPVVDLQNLDFETDKETKYKEIDKVIAVSDVHGQYDILIRLLQAHGVIDQNRQWTYGNGHLMVVGDNVDRGDKVLDILWFLFYLQKEAKMAGGKVHVLLGNHEIMVLNGDLRYTHKKYYYTSAAFTIQYHQLFREGSVLGDWIASHKVMTAINQRLFVHAGISPAFLKLGYSMKKINKTFSQKVIRQPEDDILKVNELSFLYTEEGPMWYRGYFDDAVLNHDSIDHILHTLDQKTIIVGHTSLEEISPLFDGKIIALDCSIKLGKDGQLLILEKDNLFIGDLEGKRIAIDQAEKPKRQSLFDYLYTQNSSPKLKINADVNKLLRKSKEEEYLEGNMIFADNNGNELLNLPGRLRARGNKRKMVCYLPPLKLDFKKPLLDSLGFHSHDKLKLVLPCTNGKIQQELLYKEFFLYDLYALIDTNSLRTKLMDITLTDERKKNFELTGFLIEDEKEYARRKNARVLDKVKINASLMDRASFVKMEFFQYMISNTDWSLRNRHNLEIVKVSSMEKAIAIAYDFDYSGFVGQEYAVPHESIPIENVHERYFFSYPISDKEFYETVDYFLSIEETIYALCDKATYMTPRSIKENKAYLAGFFKLLEKPRRLRKEMVRK